MNLRIHGGSDKSIRLDFSVNINPLGIPGGCIEAAYRALGDMLRYPDIQNDELIRELSERNGGNGVILGNGSCELIYAICHHIGHKYPGYGAVTAAPTFTEYGYAVEASGGRNNVFITDEEDDFALAPRMDELAEWACSSHLTGSPVRIVFICNPNNPTGELIERDRMERMACALDECGILLVVDECFLRFCGRYDEITMTGMTGIHKNVLVLDAFTKFYAMPGLRLGYLTGADGSLLEGIRDAMQPWNVSAPAYEAALHALRDEVYCERTVGYIWGNRTCLEKGLLEAGLRIIGRPEADFVMAEGPAGLKDELNKRGMDIRDCSDMMKYHDTDRSYYRIAVSGREDNEELIEEIKKIRDVKHG